MDRCFPLDYAPDAVTVCRRAKWMDLVTNAILFKINVSKTSKVTSRMAAKILSLFSVNKLDRLRAKIRTGKDVGNEEYLTSYASNLGPRKLMLEQSVYFPLRKIQFEGFEFWAPHDSDAWLTAAYGDYMTYPPAGERVNHHKVIEVRVQS